MQHIVNGAISSFTLFTIRLRILKKKHIGIYSYCHLEDIRSCQSFLRDISAAYKAIIGNDKKINDHINTFKNFQLEWFQCSIVYIIDGEYTSCTTVLSVILSHQTTNICRHVSYNNKNITVVLPL